MERLGWMMMGKVIRRGRSEEFERMIEDEGEASGRGGGEG